jgi:hypothetical protein
MAIVGVLHMDLNRGRMVGAKEVHRFARVHLRVEPNDDGTNTGKLVPTKSNDVPAQLFRAVLHLQVQPRRHLPTDNLA